MAETRNTWQQFYSKLQEEALVNNDTAKARDRLLTLAAGTDQSAFREHAAELFRNKAADYGLGTSTADIENVVNELEPFQQAYLDQLRQQPIQQQDSLTPQSSTQPGSSFLSGVLKGIASGSPSTGAHVGTAGIPENVHILQEQELLDAYDAALLVQNTPEHPNAREEAVQAVLNNLDAHSVLRKQWDILNRHVEDYGGKSDVLESLANQSKKQLDRHLQAKATEETEKKGDALTSGLLEAHKSGDKERAHDALRNLLAHRQSETDGYFVEVLDDRGMNQERRLFDISRYLGEIINRQRQQREAAFQAMQAAAAESASRNNDMNAFNLARGLTGGGKGSVKKKAIKELVKKGVGYASNVFGPEAGAAVKAGFFIWEHKKWFFILAGLIIVFIIAIFASIIILIVQLFGGGSTSINTKSATIAQNAKLITDNLCRTTVLPGSNGCNASTRDFYDNIDPGPVYPQPQYIITSFKINGYVVKNRPYTSPGGVFRPWGRYWCTDLVIDSYAAAGFSQMNGWQWLYGGPFNHWDTGNVRVMVLFFQTFPGYRFIPSSQFYNYFAQGSDGKIHSTLPPGSAIFFEWNGGEHTGIVNDIQVNQPGYGTVTTYEANAGSRQGHYSFRNGYQIDNNSIIGFGEKQ